MLHSLDSGHVQENQLLPTSQRRLKTGPWCQLALYVLSTQVFRLGKTLQAPENLRPEGIGPAYNPTLLGFITFLSEGKG